MLRSVRERLTYSNVMATTAVFVALGGTSYAVASLPRNSVGTNQIRNEGVRSSDIRDRGIGVRDISREARTALRGERGPEGPQGPPGRTVTVTPGGTVVPTGVTFSYRTSQAFTVGAAPSEEASGTQTGTFGCAAGQRVVGGGVNLQSINNTFVIDSYPDSNANTWIAHVGNDDLNNSYTFTVTAICASQ